MKIRLKKFLNKHKNRIVSFIAVFAFVPLFAFNAFAFSVPISSLPVVPDATDNAVIVIESVSGGTESISCVYDSGEYSYEFHIADNTPSAVSLAYYLTVPFNMSFNHNSYDYYIATTYYFSNKRSNFAGNSGLIGYYDVNDVFHTVSLLDFECSQSYTYDSDIYYSITSCIGRIPEDIAQYTLSMFSLVGSGSFYISNYNEMVSFVYQVPKGTDAETVNSLISAINNQTTTLGGKIDDTNDFIDKGNSSTSGIVSGNNSAIGQLDEVVSEYHATEQQFFDDFNTNQQVITSDIVGWSWGGLVNCANWVGDTMTDYYNNMGDFRQYIIYPLMLGIVLFFLGRGGSIIGHLFRKPTETTVNTKSVFRREGNTRYTTTTTTRQGGAWRK